MKKKALMIYILALFVYIVGCTPIEPVPVYTPEKPREEIKLSWDNTTTRAGWTKDLMSFIEPSLDTLDLATDVTQFCPKYPGLDKQARLKAWGEFFVALARFESSWNPKSASVDVGAKDKRDTWSIGLYQVSVVDQRWSGGGTKYTYEQLLTPKPNMDLALQLVTRWLKREPKIFLPNSSKNRYFAVALQGNRFSKIPQIIDYVKKNAPDCL